MTLFTATSAPFPNNTNGLYSQNPGILFALDKGWKSANCSNYPNFIQKAVFIQGKKSRHLQ